MQIAVTILYSGRLSQFHNAHQYSVVLRCYWWWIKYQSQVYNSTILNFCPHICATRTTLVIRHYLFKFLTIVFLFFISETCLQTDTMVDGKSPFCDKQTGVFPVVNGKHGKFPKCCRPLWYQQKQFASLCYERCWNSFSFGFTRNSVFDWHKCSACRNQDIWKISRSNRLCRWNIYSNDWQVWPRARPIHLSWRVSSTS